MKLSLIDFEVYIYIERQSIYGSVRREYALVTVCRTVGLLCYDAGF